MEFRRVVVSGLGALTPIGNTVPEYWESLVRDLAAEGLIESRDHNELAQEVFSYMTGVLMQAKIENSPKQLDRLKHGILRLLGLKAQPVAVHA